MAIDFDLNFSGFQDDLLELERDDVTRFLAALRKVQQSWQQVYRDKGLNMEHTDTRTGPDGQRLYSLRVSKKFRALVYRDGNYLVFLSLHSDHDSAYD